LTPAESDITVSVQDLSNSGLKNFLRWGDVAKATLAEEGVVFGHVDVVFVDVETMTQLNIEHMGGSGPTDVLAFPMDAPQLLAGQLPNVDISEDGPPVHLGDIVICPQVCQSQAPSHVGSVEGEYCLLAVHAALHLLGYDHVSCEERMLMQDRERVHLKAFGFRHPVGVSG